jgi:preprotein translocase subunit SecB
VATTAPLRLDFFLIDRLEVAAVAGFKPERGDVDVDIDVQPQHLRSADDDHKHQIVLDVRFKPAKTNSAPYRGRVVGRGFFSVADELDEADVARYVVYNGSAILLGLLRAQVAQVTALGRWGQYLIPPINLVATFASEAASSDDAAGRPDEQQ